jgi:predicted anti-sigma-YlaC factor YlaD
MPLHNSKNLKGDFAVNREQFLRWIDQIFATREEEIDCERLKELLPAYVDFEVANEDRTLTEASLAVVADHLCQCADCAAEHAAILAVARMVSEGALPEPETSLQQFEESAEEEAVA